MAVLAIEIGWLMADPAKYVFVAPVLGIVAERLKRG
jgi:hypothetical protein